MFTLMLKQHYDTGISYLCVTKRTNFRKYKGSGTLWGNLISKYPESEIRTNVLFTSNNLQEFNAECLYYSALFDVVDNNDFANLVPELGYDSELGSNLEVWWQVASEEEKRKAINKRIESMKKTYADRDLPLMYYARLGLKKYHEENGVDNCMHIESVKERVIRTQRKTIFEKYGVDHNMKIPGVSKKVALLRKISFQEKYGVDNYLQIPGKGAEIAKLREATLINKYGYSNPSQIPEFKEKISAGIKRGLENRETVVCKYCDFKSKAINSHEPYCKNNPNKIKHIEKQCIYCGVKSTPGNIARWHNDNCKDKEQK